MFDQKNYQRHKDKKEREKKLSSQMFCGYKLKIENSDSETEKDRFSRKNKKRSRLNKDKVSFKRIYEVFKKEKKLILFSIFSSLSGLFCLLIYLFLKTKETNNYLLLIIFSFSLIYSYRMLVLENVKHFFFEWIEIFLQLFRKIDSDEGSEIFIDRKRKRILRQTESKDFIVISFEKLFDLRIDIKKETHYFLKKNLLFLSRDEILRMILLFFRFEKIDLLKRFR